MVVENKHLFTVVEASMAISSCIFGVGIISVPYGIIINGIWVGIALHLVLILCMTYCTYLYIVSRDMFQIKTYSDMSYMTFGKSGIYITNGLIAVSLSGIMVLYFIVFA